MRTRMTLFLALVMVIAMAPSLAHAAGGVYTFKGPTFVAKAKDGLGLVPWSQSVLQNLECRLDLCPGPLTNVAVPTDAPQGISCHPETEFQRATDYGNALDLAVSIACTSQMYGLSADGIAKVQTSYGSWQFDASIGRIDKEISEPQIRYSTLYDCTNDDFHSDCSGSWWWHVDYHMVLWPGWYWASYDPYSGGQGCYPDLQPERLICSYDIYVTF